MLRRLLLGQRRRDENEEKTSITQKDEAKNSTQDESIINSTKPFTPVGRKINEERTKKVTCESESEDGSESERDSDSGETTEYSSDCSLDDSLDECDEIQERQGFKMVDDQATRKEFPTLENRENDNDDIEGMKKMSSDECKEESGTQERQIKNQDADCAHRFQHAKGLGTTLFTRGNDANTNIDNNNIEQNNNSSYGQNNKTFDCNNTKKSMSSKYKKNNNNNNNNNKTHNNKTVEHPFNSRNKINQNVESHPMENKSAESRPRISTLNPKRPPHPPVRGNVSATISRHHSFISRDRYTTPGVSSNESKTTRGQSYGGRSNTTEKRRGISRTKSFTFSSVPTKPAEMSHVSKVERSEPKSVKCKKPDNKCDSRISEEVLETILKLDFDELQQVIKVAKMNERKEKMPQEAVKWDKRVKRDKRDNRGKEGTQVKDKVQDNEKKPEKEEKQKKQGKDENQDKEEKLEKEGKDSRQDERKGQRKVKKRDNQNKDSAASVTNNAKTIGKVPVSQGICGVGEGCNGSSEAVKMNLNTDLEDILKGTQKSNQPAVQSSPLSQPLTPPPSPSSPQPSLSPLQMTIVQQRQESVESNQSMDVRKSPDGCQIEACEMEGKSQEIKDEISSDSGVSETDTNSLEAQRYISTKVILKRKKHLVKGIADLDARLLTMQEHKKDVQFIHDLFDLHNDGLKNVERNNVGVPSVQSLKGVLGHQLREMNDGEFWRKMKALQDLGIPYFGEIHEHITKLHEKINQSLHDDRKCRSRAVQNMRFEIGKILGMCEGLLDCIYEEWRSEQ